MASMFNAVLTEKKLLHPDLGIFRVRSDLDLKPFHAGQYVAIGVPDSAEQRRFSKRAYSIASAPGEVPELEFFISCVENGELTPRLFELEPGDRLFMAKKIVGKFTLKETLPDSSLIFVATGTGVAPFLSMLKTEESWKGRKAITLVYGVRKEVDLAYHDYLSSLEKKKEAFHYFPVLSRESWAGRSGHVQDVLFAEEFQANFEGAEVFLCGNPVMVDDVAGSLKTRGFLEAEKGQKGNLHLERYW